MVDLLAQQPVGGDRVGHARRLHRDLEVLEVEAVHELDPLGRGAHQRLDGVGELEVAQVLGQRAGVDAHAQRRAVALGTSMTSAVFSGPPMLPGLMRTQCAPASIALIASVWLKWMSAITGIGESRTIVLSASTSCSRGHGDADDVGAGLGDAADLVHRRAEVGRLGLGHRLDGHGRAAPDGDAAHVDLPRGGHARSVRGAHALGRPRRTGGLARRRVVCAPRGGIPSLGGRTGDCLCKSCLHVPHIPRQRSVSRGHAVAARSARSPTTAALAQQPDAGPLWKAFPLTAGGRRRTAQRAQGADRASSSTTLALGRTG